MVRYLTLQQLSLPSGSVGVWADDVVSVNALDLKHRGVQMEEVCGCIVRSHRLGMGRRWWANGDAQGLDSRV